MTAQFKRRLPVIAKVFQRPIDQDFRYGESEDQGLSHQDWDLFFLGILLD